MTVEGYEQLGEFEGEWTPSKRDERRQRQSEDIRRDAREMASKAPLMSDEQYRTLAHLIRTARDVPRSELMRWRLRLFCGHVVERTAHHTYTTVHAATMAGRACEVCGLDPATIVAAEALGRVEEPRRARSDRATDRAQIEGSIARHDAEAARLRKLLEEDA